jgi:hypothetical protein
MADLAVAADRGNIYFPTVNANPVDGGRQCGNRPPVRVGPTRP